MLSATSLHKEEVTFTVYSLAKLSVRQNCGRSYTKKKEHCGELWPSWGICSRVGGIVKLIDKSKTGLRIRTQTCSFATCRRTLIEFRNTQFLIGITHRIRFGTKEVIDVKSGKCIIPVLEMLLSRQAAETDDCKNLSTNPRSVLAGKGISRASSRNNSGLNMVSPIMSLSACTLSISSRLICSNKLNE